MKHKRLTATAGAAMLGGFFALAPLGAVAFEIDFDLPDGTIVTNQYQAAEFGGLTISASNRGGGPDIATIYNPDDDEIGRDPDLEQNAQTRTEFKQTKAWFWNSGTWNEDESFRTSPERDEIKRPGESGRKILIVQENDCNSGICEPDDEAGGPNFLVFDFNAPVSIEHLDIFDIDSTESAKVAFYDQAGVALPTGNDAYDDFGISASITGLTGLYGIGSSQVGGDSGAGRFFFGDGGSGVENVRSMVVAFSSSGAVSGLRGTTAVSEPGTLVLFGGVLAGLVALRRRNRRA